MKGDTKADLKVDPSKGKAVDLAVTQIERQYGKGAIMKLGADAMLGEIPIISTGSLSLDLALGVGGLPKGRVVEIFGPEASGKTTLALHVVAEAQKKGALLLIMPPISAPCIRVGVKMLLMSHLTLENRHWRLPRSWFGVAPWM
jgi:protein RecA